MNRALEGGTSIAALMKWIGIIGALLSFGTAIYALVRSEGELRERGRVVTEQYATGNAQQVAGDYASAWDSFALAASGVAPLTRRGRTSAGRTNGPTRRGIAARGVSTGWGIGFVVGEVRRG